MTPIPSPLKTRIISLIHKNHSTRKIAAETGASKSTISRIRRAEGIASSPIRNGRPRLLSVHHVRRIFRASRAGKISNAVQGRRLLAAVSGLRVSADTIRRALNRCGLEARVKPRKPLLSPRNIKRRLAFARKHAKWTVDDWKRVIWSDETKINLFGSDGREYCYRFPGERLLPQHIKPTVKHGGGSLMLWGCFMAAGVGYATKIDNIMDGELYREILNDEMQWTVEHYELEPGEFIFQHDNDPKHTARATTQWLADHRIRVLDWPSQSPDLNPIEHLWHHLKQRLAAYEEPPRGVDELWDRVQNEWEAIDPAFCARLVESMPKRIAAVLKAKGGNTEW